jgi:monofunctional biosynthetic peptidoglycan transglycosylase
MTRLIDLIYSLFIAYLLAVLALSVVYLFLPPVSTVMMASGLRGDGMQRTWVKFDNISPNLVRAVLVAEDARFCEHHGIDWQAVHKNIKQATHSSRAPKGASTITMQVTKNLFLWNGRSWLRKALEAPIALWIDLVWPKKRILEVYLNIAQWGDGIYGIEQAARNTYGQSAKYLTPQQAAMLTVVLPDPERRHARSPGSAMVVMASTVNARAMRSGEVARCVLR